jgi:hypothetical protein
VTVRAFLVAVLGSKHFRSEEFMKLREIGCDVVCVELFGAGLGRAVEVVVEARVKSVIAKNRLTPVVSDG